MLFAEVLRMPDGYPGIAPAPLTKESLGTQGEMTPGPDNLDPSYPEDKRELVRRGYFTVEEDEVNKVGGASDAEMPSESLFDPFSGGGGDGPRMPPL